MFSSEYPTFSNRGSFFALQQLIRLRTITKEMWVRPQIAQSLVELYYIYYVLSEERGNKYA